MDFGLTEKLNALNWLQSVNDFY